MTGVSKTVYRVTRSFGHDVAMICEVRDGDVNGGNIRETRDRRIVLGGVDSFWLVTGEKKENKPVIERDETPPLLPHFSAMSSLAAPIPENAGFSLRFGQIGAAVRRDAVSFVSATRLSVAYSSRDITHEDVVARLREGVLAIPSENDVIAIEVRAGSWLTTHFERNSSNLYGLSPSTSMRSISVNTLENRPETIKLSSGLVLYVTPPKWSPGREIDLRSENEILQAAEYWLHRATSVAGVQSASSSRLIDLFRQYMSSTVSAEEQADLSAVVGLLSGRQPLIEMMSKMLAREPAFQERIRKFEQSEKARLSTDIRSQLEAEIQSEKARLSEIRASIADAETKVALASHREILLRREAEKHDDSIRAKITEAARALSREASRDSNQLREELDGLRDKVSELTRPAECLAEVVAASEKTHKEDHSGHMVFADHEACKSIIGGLSSAIQMPQADVVTIILWSTENIPVLIGSNSSAAAVDIAAAIGGDDSAIVFCDPSRISLQDLLRDETSGLAAAVVKARACPQMLVPVAVCGITNGPCEYWVPHLIEARRLGKMPRNLAVIASAGIDGMRVPVPDSVLGYFAPLTVPTSSKPGRNLFAGAWRADLEVSRKRLAEALELLSQSDSLENGALQRLARILARTPIGIDMKEVASALQRHHEWLTSLSRQGQQHEFKSYFTNVGE